MSFVRKVVVILIFSLFFSPIYSQSKQSDQQLYPRFAFLNQEIEKIHKQALENEEVANRGIKLNNKINNLMMMKYPEAKKLVTQKEEIKNQFNQAKQSGGSQETLLAIKKQYKDISIKIDQYQNKVLQSPEIRKEAQAFEDFVRDKMRQINPDVDNMIAQLEDLRKQLMEQKNGLK